jgi:hypothetical protein
MTYIRTSTTNLLAQEYTIEEQRKIIDYFKELKSFYIKTFLTNSGLPKSGSKSQLMIRITEAIESGTIQYADLVNYLDTIMPWGKQHIFLYKGPEREVENWRVEDFCRQTLEQNGNIHFLNARLPLILPIRLSLSSIDYTPGVELRIFSVQRRDYRERYPEHDEIFEIDGIQIEREAYIHQVLRGTIIFYWDLVSNHARLQISQLPSRGSYEKAEEDFKSLIQPWLPFTLFQKLDLRRSITRLNELEDSGDAEVRSHNFSYRTLGGRAISAKSPTSHDSVLGEPIIDIALRNIRESGVGHLGNFFWLANEHNSFEKEIHTVIVGNKGRINFTTPNRREDIEYVLSRVRALCR